MKEIKILKEIIEELSNQYNPCPRHGHPIQIEKINNVIKSLEKDSVKNKGNKSWEMIFLGIIFLGWLIYMIWFNPGGGFKF